MRNWNRAIVAVVLMAVIIMAAVNLYFVFSNGKNGGRPYRVEINRLAKEIEKSGLEQIDLSECEYVTHVQRQTGDDPAFFDVDSDYYVCRISGEIYRFDYTFLSKEGNRDRIIAVNAALAGMTLVLLAVMIYIREKVLKPFVTLREVPYELAKGNLTVPLKENKARFFGRFVWGVDLLRETLEQRKQRELDLQREKKTLVLSISHDIKTPLSAIKLYSQALSKGLYADARRQGEIAGKIQEKADEIEEFVSQIIKASNEDFLDLEVSPGEFYLSELVGRISGYYREKLELVRISFSVGAYADVILKGDLERGVEVLQNMMENAIKYGGGGRIELEFSVEEDCQLMTVRNEGCTLLETELPHIFDSFWRGSNVGDHAGSGLGLYICRQLMHKMDGEVFAEVEGGSMRMTAAFRKV